jgi:hypothetical protein
MPDFCNRHFPVRYPTAIASLMKMGVEPRRIDILAVGIYENYNGEIREQEPLPGTLLAGDTKIMLKVGISSAVDFVPYQFFYGLEAGTKRGAGWEDRARELMAPFDAAAICTEAVACHRSTQLSFGSVEREQLLRFLTLFRHSLEPGEHQAREAWLWSVLLPTFHSWAGNPAAVVKVLKFFFGYDFTIVESTPAGYDVPDEIQYRLGSSEARLGQATTVGATFLESDSAYSVTIEGVPTRDMSSLLPGKPLRKKVEQLLTMCMPSNLDFQIVVKATERQTILGDPAGRACLGYTAFI